MSQPPAHLSEAAGAGVLDGSGEQRRRRLLLAVALGPPRARAIHPAIARAGAIDALDPACFSARRYTSVEHPE